MLSGLGTLLFQFYKVRLKDLSKSASNALSLLFQFYKVRLKDAGTKGESNGIEFQFYKVRLKDVTDGLSLHAFFYFNSIKFD